VKKLYLDIDGVLLTTKQIKTADDVIPFIEFVTTNFDCYWLTTHCKGNIGTALNYLSDYFDSTTLKKLEKINPTNWITLKTEAIDFKSDFIWLEDYPFESEKKVLMKHNAIHKLITVDLNKVGELMRVMVALEKFISSK
jgi:hypothetical protein